MRPSRAGCVNPVLGNTLLVAALSPRASSSCYTVFCFWTYQNHYQEAQRKTQGSSSLCQFFKNLFPNAFLLPLYLGFTLGSVIALLTCPGWQDRDTSSVWHS